MRREAAGTALGQFSGPVNISVGKRGVYVADTGNNRIQKFDPAGPGAFQHHTEQRELRPLDQSQRARRRGRGGQSDKRVVLRGRHRP